MVSFYQFALDCQAVFIEPTSRWFRWGVPYLNHPTNQRISMTNVDRKRRRDSWGWPALAPARPGFFQWRVEVEPVFGDRLKEGRQEPQKRPLERVPHRRLPVRPEAAHEFARRIKITTPNDRPHVIRVLETAAAILRDKLEGRNVA
jgi:hypothetical protein